MTTRDRELQQWMEDWQSAEVPGTPPDRIRNYVRRRSRLLTLWIAAEVAVGVSGLGFVLYVIVAESDRIHQALMSLLVAIVVGVLAFDWWNWRGTLRAAAQDTTTYLTLSMERLRRLRRANRVSWLVLAAQVAVFTPWIAYRLYGGGTAATSGRQLFAWGLLIGMTLSAAVWAYLVARWVDRDARVLEGLASELRDA